MFFGACALAMVLVAALCLRDLMGAARAAAAVPLIAVWSAAAVRANPARRDGASRDVFLVGGGAALASLTLFGVPLLFAAAFPAALIARRRERQLRGARWSELQHEAAGDSLSWSGT